MGKLHNSHNTENNCQTQRNEDIDLPYDQTVEYALPNGFHPASPKVILLPLKSVYYSCLKRVEKA